MRTCSSCLEEGEFPPLFRKRKLLVVDEADKLLGIELLTDHRIGGLLLSDFIGDERALVHGRKKAVAPEWRPDGCGNVWTQNDVTGQILVHRYRDHT